MTELVGPALVVAVPMSVAACGGSSGPEEAAGATSGAESRRAEAVGAGPAADATPVAAGVPGLIGGNAGRASGQTDLEREPVLEDAGGRGRPVDDPAGWRVRGSRPGPRQRITGHPVAPGVVKASENCARVRG
ncbi:hypothetical protein ACFY3N_15335 [Streptomyces sp. NPDC000348]|uniref:hypothetical protein n=1 Tax=Streptomyces sp. NPDC000348 TaxID=3364538 RepID=UPI00368B16C4